MPADEPSPGPPDGTRRDPVGRMLGASDWLVLRDCPLGGRAPRIALALLHPRVGVALLDFAPAEEGEAVGHLRRALDLQRFPTFYGGYPPIARIVLPTDRLPDLRHILTASFRAEPPLSLKGGDAWVHAVRAALEAQPVFTEPAWPEPEPQRRPRWQVMTLIGGAAAAGAALAAVLPFPDRAAHRIATIPSPPAAAPSPAGALIAQVPRPADEVASSPAAAPPTAASDTIRPEAGDASEAAVAVSPAPARPAAGETGEPAPGRVAQHEDTAAMAPTGAAPSTPDAVAPGGAHPDPSALVGPGPLSPPTPMQDEGQAPVPEPHRPPWTQAAAQGAPGPSAGAEHAGGAVESHGRKPSGDESSRAGSLAAAAPEAPHAPVRAGPPAAASPQPPAAATPTSAPQRAARHDAEDRERCRRITLNAMLGGILTHDELDHLRRRCRSRS